MKNSNLTIFVAELVGTFGLLVAATGSIVYDARVGNTLGPIFVAVIHFVGIAIVIYAFGKYSMAHFNPAVTIGYLISGYINARSLPIYFGAQTIGAIFGTVFVKYVIGDFANQGLNSPNYSYQIPFFYTIEIFATIFLMGIILLVVHVKSLNRFTGIGISGIIALDVYFLGPISGASMNPIRSLTPALVSGIFDDLWLYWTAPFIGAVFVGLLYRKKFSRSKTLE